MARKVQLGMYSTIELDTVKGLESYAWPGGYPIVYYTSDGDTLCSDCATTLERENAQPEAIVTSRITGVDVLEGSAIDHGIVSCAECNKELIGLDSDWEWVCKECGQVNDNDDSTCGSCTAPKPAE